VTGEERGEGAQDQIYPLTLTLSLKRECVVVPSVLWMSS